MRVGFSVCGAAGVRGMRIDFCLALAARRLEEYWEGWGHFFLGTGPRESSCAVQARCESILLEQQTARNRFEGGCRMSGAYSAAGGVRRTLEGDLTKS